MVVDFSINESVLIVVDDVNCVKFNWWVLVIDVLLVIVGECNV